MTVFETVGPGSIPGRVTQNVLGVCRIRTRLCEGRRPGSIPGEDMRGGPQPNLSYRSELKRFVQSGNRIARNSI